jgi:hypothetical protein
MESGKRDRIVRSVLELVNTRNPELVSPYAAIDFPLELFRRRWYDNDPYLWLVINGLQNADLELIEKVTVLLKKELEGS